MLPIHKELLSVDKTLYRRIDASFLDVARDEMLALMDQNADFCAPHINWSMKLYESSTRSQAHLRITVVDRSKYNPSALLYIAAILTILVVLWAV